MVKCKLSEILLPYKNIKNTFMLACNFSDENHKLVQFSPWGEWTATDQFQISF